MKRSIEVVAAMIVAPTVLVLPVATYASQAAAQPSIAPRLEDDDFVAVLVGMACRQKIEPAVSDADLNATAQLLATHLGVNDYGLTAFQSDRAYYFGNTGFVAKNSLAISIGLNRCLAQHWNAQPIKEFYGIPGYEGARVVEKLDTPASTLVSLRLLTNDSVDKALNFYRGKLGSGITESSNGDVRILRREFDGKVQLVMVNPEADGTEISLTTQR